RTPNSNPYAEYRSLTRTMDNNINDSTTNPIYNQTLQHAANWLAENNLYLYSFANLLLQTNQNNPFPRAQHAQTNTETSPNTNSTSYLYDRGNDENPYYDDTIMKYMHRPLTPEFENLTYPQYFEQYSITSSRPSIPCTIHQLYFYQQLLLNHPARSETVYKTNPNQTYCNKFLSLFPDFLTNIQNQTTTTYNSRLTCLNNNFNEILNRLLNSLANQLSTNLHEIIHSQLNNLKIFPHIFLLTATLELPPDQYKALLTIFIYMDKADNSTPWDTIYTNRMFKQKTNLLLTVRLQPDARVIYLNNSLIQHNICNGTVDVITDIDPKNQSVRIAFSIRGLTLPKVSFALDDNIFSHSQVYVALSRCSIWDNVEISYLDDSVFAADDNIIVEYQRLENITRTNSTLFL
ncbi:24731_t:CDS:2, partial [Gigaspora margarita]